MNDYDVSNLSEAKNEYSARLVNMLSPLIVAGVKSLFKDAKKLCIENNENSKYLMTFQNFLARIPKWNPNIIEQETQRIIRESECNYLEDLIVCVHIAQLKILTSIRVGQKQKKIDLTIPKLDQFIHSVYIEVARKIYSNVYLFEDDVLPLEYQKHMRECELIVRECILNVIRNSIPVESILRSYIEETVEEDVEVKEEVIEEEREVDVSENDVMQGKDVMHGGEKEAQSNDAHSDNYEANGETKKLSIMKEDSMVEEPIHLETREIVAPSASVNNALLTFNDNDNVLNMGTNVETVVEAPKTIERLEEISDIRNEQRRLEEMEEEEDEYEPLEKLVIHSKTPVELETLEVHDLNRPLEINTDPLLEDIEVIS